VQVRCPFPHDKGLENNASASFNTKHRIYKCFACTAEDRDSGMSETSFVSKVFKTTYDNAAKLKNILMDSDGWNQATTNLLQNMELKTYLNETRGLYDSTLVEYQLGFTGAWYHLPSLLLV
jgi:DNA primase